MYFDPKEVPQLSACATEKNRSSRSSKNIRPVPWCQACLHSIVENTICRWKSKYGGMEVSEAKRLRDLEQENARLKRLLADAELDKAALKELVEGKW